MARVMRGRTKEKEKGFFDVISDVVSGTVQAATGDFGGAAKSFSSAVGAKPTTSENLGTVVGGVTQGTEETQGTKETAPPPTTPSWPVEKPDFSYLYDEEEWYR
jgi:hypothetical protein